MLNIDPRLLDAVGAMNLTEDFNRLLALIDDLETRVKALESPADSAEGGGT